MFVIEILQLYYHYFICLSLFSVNECKKLISEHGNPNSSLNPVLNESKLIKRSGYYAMCSSYLVWHVPRLAACNHLYLSFIVRTFYVSELTKALYLLINDCVKGNMKKESVLNALEHLSVSYFDLCLRP